MRRRLAWLVLLLLPFAAKAVDTTTNNKTFTYGLRLYITDHYVNGDSGDVAAAYPTSEDTTGKRQDLTWVGGAIQQWSFTPDSSEVYTIYGRASCCSDTAVSGLMGRYFQADGAFEGMISDARAIEDALITPAKMATGQKFFTEAGSDSGEFDVLSAGTIMNAPGGVGIFRGAWEFDQAGLIYFNGPQVVFADSVDFVGAVRLNGLVTANGDVLLGNSSADQTIVTGDLTVQDDMLFGTATTDSAAFAGSVTFNRDLRYLLAVCDTLDTYSSPEDTTLVDGVSELIAAGYYVHCEVDFNWDLAALYAQGFGIQSRRSIRAAPMSQTAATGDSVYVVADGTMPDATTIGYCVKCYGTVQPVNQ